jgi:hypothetical protein
MDQGKSSLSQITAKNEIVKRRSSTGWHLFARQDKKLEYVLAVVSTSNINDYLQIYI